MLHVVSFDALLRMDDMATTQRMRPDVANKSATLNFKWAKRQAMQNPRLVWTMIGDTPCLSDGQIHREGSCDKRTTPMDPCTSQLARYGAYRRMEPSCRLHPMYKLQHAHTRPHAQRQRRLGVQANAATSQWQTRKRQR